MTTSARETGADISPLAKGAVSFMKNSKADTLLDLKQRHPEARILVHLISPSVIELADVVGSTSQLIHASQELDAPLFIVATEEGILHKMRSAPLKKYPWRLHGRRGCNLRELRALPWMKK